MSEPTFWVFILVIDLKSHNIAPCKPTVQVPFQLMQHTPLGGDREYVVMNQALFFFFPRPLLEVQ